MKVIGFIAGFLTVYFMWWLSGEDILVRSPSSSFVFFEAVLFGFFGRLLMSIEKD